MPAFLILLFCVFALSCAGQSVNELAEKFRAFSSGKGIRAEFVQTRHLNDLDMQVKIQGEMVCEKNGRLRWEVKTPVRSITIIGPDKLRHCDLETGKTAVIPADKIPWLQLLKECMTDWISGDPDQLKTRFELKAKDSHTLRLLPKTAQLRPVIKTVEIRADATFRAIESILIEEVSGDRLEIRFVKVQKDPVLPEKLWQIPSS